MNVLYLEDINLIREQLSRKLKMQGYEVLEARTLSEAYTLHKVLKPTIYIIDINVPLGDTLIKDIDGNNLQVTNGIELAYLILKEQPKSYVLILSGNLRDDNQIREGIIKGVKDFIVKPYTEERILQSLQKAELCIKKGICEVKV